MTRRRPKITQESATAVRLLFRDLFGEDAETVADELLKYPIGTATTPAEKLIEELALTARAVFDFEVEQLRKTKDA